MLDDVTERERLTCLRDARELAEALAWRDGESGKINTSESLLYHWMDMNNLVAALIDFRPDVALDLTSHHTVPIAERLKASDAAYNRISDLAQRLPNMLAREELRARVRAAADEPLDEEARLIERCEHEATEELLLRERRDQE